MKHSTRSFLFLALLVPSASAGGIEHYCNASGIEVTEAWPVSTGIPWSVHTGAVGTVTCPGFGPNGCAAALTGNVTQWPAIQSLSAASSAWTNASVPSFASPASTFSLAPVPTLFPVANWMLLDVPHLLFAAGPDGVNLMTCWEPAGTYQFLGGPMALAMTNVGVVLATGVITEADIGFNVRSEFGAPFSGVPFWSFTESNALFGIDVASHPGGGFNMPVLGFADLQGVATHEIGHLAGLGHSMIESSAGPTLSKFPCMFPVAQGEPFTTVITQPTSGCNIGTWTPLTVTGTRLGRSARILRRDDVCAIADGYPTAAFQNNLGTISGTVSLFGSPVLAANVVAIAKRSPDVIRTATLSYTGGVYNLRGLAPGDYYVYVEPIDQNPAAPNANGFYFTQNDVPNFAFLGPTGCISFPTFFDTELWDVAEASVETSNANANLLTVTAGATTTANFDVGFSGNVYTVRNSASAFPYASPRGLQIIGTAGTYPAIELRINAGPAWAGSTVTIVFDNVRQTRQLGAQLSLVNVGTAAGVPTTITGTAGANGDLFVSLPLTSAAAFQTIFTQARLVKPGAQLFTNSPVLWVTN